LVLADLACLYEALLEQDRAPVSRLAGAAKPEEISLPERIMRREDESSAYATFGGVESAKQCKTCKSVR
jgi:hypothetical protein